MVGDEMHDYVLNFGKTDGSNLPNMPEDKYFCVGYNSRFGLIDVKEGYGKDGTSCFEGRVNIEHLVNEAELGTPELNQTVETHIMDAYHNSIAQDSDKDPVLEVLLDSYGVAKQQI